MPELVICLDCGAMVPEPDRPPMLCARCRAARGPARRRGERRSNPATIARRRESHRLYGTAAWRRVRELVKARDGACVTCGALTDLTVDHVIPATVDPSRALDLANLRTLCRSCHGRRDGARSHERGPTIG